jgi:dipeptidase E
MRKLFLASVASITLDKVEELLPDKPSNLNLAFVTTAADPYEDKPWLYEDRDTLLRMGFRVKDFDIKNKTQETLNQELNNVDVVFVGGGNVFYLLEKTLESGFDTVVKQLIDKGVVYIGSSAGSALVCPTIEYGKSFDDPKKAPNLNTYDGLGIVDFLIIPHYGKEKYKQKQEVVEDEWRNKGFDIKLLTDNQAIIIDGEECKIIEV